MRTGSGASEIMAYEPRISIPNQEEEEEEEEEEDEEEGLGGLGVPTAEAETI